MFHFDGSNVSSVEEGIMLFSSTPQIAETTGNAPLCTLGARYTHLVLVTHTWCSLHTPGARYAHPENDFVLNAGLRPSPFGNIKCPWSLGSGLVPRA